MINLEARERGALQSNLCGERVIKMSDTDTSSHAIECTAISDVELCTMYLLLQDRNDSNP
jgi:hypothetical protein